MTPWYIERSKKKHFPFRAARRLLDRGLDPAVALNSFESLLRAAEKAVQPVPERPRTDGGAGRFFALRFQGFFGQHVRRNRSGRSCGISQDGCVLWWDHFSNMKGFDGSSTCPNSGNWALLAQISPGTPIGSIVSDGQISSKFVLTWRSMLVLGLCNLKPNISQETSEWTNQLGPLHPETARDFPKIGSVCWPFPVAARCGELCLKKS